MSEYPIEDNHQHVPNNDVVCLKCNFRYGAEHRKSDDSYECPLCALEACQSKASKKTGVWFIEPELSDEAQLNWATVDEIRRLYFKKEYSMARIARIYSVSQATIKRIVDRKAYVRNPEKMSYQLVEMEIVYP